MPAKWIPGPMLGIFMGATWVKQGFMITMLSVRGEVKPGETVEMIWPGADSILLEVESIDVESRYQASTLDKAFREGVPLRRPVIVKAPDDHRLHLESGHILSVPEDMPYWPVGMRLWVHEAPPGILLAAPGSLDHKALAALPPPEERDYRRLVKLVEAKTI